MAFSVQRLLRPDKDNVGHLHLSSTFMPSSKPPQKRGRKSKPVDPDSLGGKIRACREDKGLTLVQVSKEIGIKHPSLVDIESGRTKQPTQRTLILLGRLLESTFDLDWLREYVEGEKRNVEILEQDEQKIVEYYRKMPDDIKRKAGKIMEALSNGGTLPYSEDPDANGSE